VKDRVPWIVVRQWDRGEQDSFGSYDGTLTMLVASPSTGPDHSAVETSPEVALLEHDAGEGDWMTQDGWLAHDAAVFMDLNFPRRNSRLSVYELPSGQPAAWSDDGQVSHVAPEASVGDDALAYITGLPKTRMCLRALDLGDLRSHKLACGATGEVFGDPAVNERSVTFSRLVGWRQPPNEKRCKTLNIVDLRTGRHDRSAEAAIADHARCIAWDGVVVGGGVAWDEVDPTFGNVGISPGYYRAPSGAITQLGRMDTDSMVACGGRLHWQVGAATTDLIVEWEPGSAPQTIRNVPNTSPTALQCTDNRWLTTRIDDITGHDEKLTIVALDTRLR
jgi:hypothetical protein